MHAQEAAMPDGITLCCVCVSTVADPKFEYRGVYFSFFLFSLIFFFFLLFFFLHLIHGQKMLERLWGGSSRVENGTGKSRPDRLRLPFKPAVNRFREKNRKMRKQKRENGRERERERLGCFPDRFHGSRFQPGKFPREFPYLS